MVEMTGGHGSLAADSDDEDDDSAPPRSSCFLYFFSRLLYLTKKFYVVCIFSLRSVFFVFYAMARSGLRQKK